MPKTLDELLEKVDVLKILGRTDRAVAGIAYDSRRVREGDVFVARPGARSDGHLFVDDAVGRGACAAVVENGARVDERGDLTVIRVADSRRALAQLAASFYGHPSRGLTLVGVTGTNGKTSTTLLLESILKKAGFSVGVIGTLGHRWPGVERTASLTTPESLDLQKLFHEMTRQGVTHVVMEVSSHALALGRVEGSAFAGGVFTNLSLDHLDFHQTLEDYFAAKSLLFTSHLEAGDAPGFAVINTDDPYGARLSEQLRSSSRKRPIVWSYSASVRECAGGGMGDGGPGICVEDAVLGPEGIRAVLRNGEEVLTLESPLVGRLNLYNVLCAVTTALALGVPRKAVIEGVRRLDSVRGRLQRIPTGTGFEVVVDYAHTPDAMEKSLTCLREVTEGRLVVVFGCGGDRDRTKRPVMGETAARLADLVILTSDNPRTEDPEHILADIEEGVKRSGLKTPCQVEVNRRKAIRLALSLARSGDTVFIGGKGHETYQIVGDQKFPFDDGLEVRRYLESVGKDGIHEF